MTEEENKGVETEVSEAVAQATESNEAQEEVQETPEQRRQRNDAEYNWAEMRRHMREKEREIAELKDQQGKMRLANNKIIYRLVQLGIKFQAHCFHHQSMD